MRAHTGMESATPELLEDMMPAVGCHYGMPCLAASGIADDKPGIMPKSKCVNCTAFAAVAKTQAADEETLLHNPS